MDGYFAGGDQNVAPTPGTTALVVYSPGTTRRGYLTYFLLTVPGTPVADNVLAWAIRRFTARGTGTPAVPEPKDPASPPATLLAEVNQSAEPTFGNFLFPSAQAGGIGVHQRNLMFWNARPGGEIVFPAVANNGIAWTPIHGSFTGLASAVADWTE